MTLTELQLSIKKSLEERFALPLWVSCEISDIKVNYSGHCYLELIEKGEQDTTPRAQAKGVVWRSRYAALAAYFESQTGQGLARGMKILAKVVVTYHELYGISLQINDIDPAYTLGDMERQKQLTIQKLQQDGVWELNQLLTMPYVPQRIAIISSANAAGYQDFCKQIEGGGYHFSLTLFDAFMQGDAAEQSIIDALDRVYECMEEFDCVVVIRGGGSTSDLNCFNSYRICSHIAQFPLPVITGIGHERDQSVADMVAAQALKTPTAVAIWFIERLQHIEGWLEAAALKLSDQTTKLTHSQHLLLERSQQELVAFSRQLIERERISLSTIRESLPERVASLLALQRMRLDGAQQAAESHSPSHLLKLGYAIARIKGHAVESAGEIERGAIIELEMADAMVSAEVQSVKKKNE